MIFPCFLKAQADTLLFLKNSIYFAVFHSKFVFAYNVRKYFLIYGGSPSDAQLLPDGNSNLSEQIAQYPAICSERVLSRSDAGSTPAGT